MTFAIYNMDDDGRLHLMIWRPQYKVDPPVFGEYDRWLFMEELADHVFGVPWTTLSNALLDATFENVRLRRLSTSEDDIMNTIGRPRGPERWCTWIVDVQGMINFLNETSVWRRWNPKGVPRIGLYDFSNLLRDATRKSKRIKLTEGYKKQIASRQGWACKACTAVLEGNFHVDHIKRYAEGGGSSEYNLQALCAACHAKKSAQESAGFRVEAIGNEN